jgi:hypothetical protein
MKGKTTTAIASQNDAVQGHTQTDPSSACASQVFCIAIEYMNPTHWGLTLGNARTTATSCTQGWICNVALGVKTQVHKHTV